MGPEDFREGSLDVVFIFGQARMTEAEGLLQDKVGFDSYGI